MSDINKNNQITQDDFTFVQLDKKIHDAKFETQSSTFLKDAMKRFVKNKASVVCGILLGILAILSIFVPILNPNDIVTSASEYQFLAPRWFNKTNALGFLDGTTKYKNVNLDDEMLDFFLNHKTYFEGVDIHSPILNELIIQVKKKVYENLSS